MSRLLRLCSRASISHRLLPAFFLLHLHKEVGKGIWVIGPEIDRTVGDLCHHGGTLGQGGHIDVMTSQDGVALAVSRNSGQPPLRNVQTIGRSGKRMPEAVEDLALALDSATLA